MNLTQVREYATTVQARVKNLEEELRELKARVVDPNDIWLGIMSTSHCVIISKDEAVVQSSLPTVQVIDVH